MVDIVMTLVLAVLPSINLPLALRYWLRCKQIRPYQFTQKNKIKSIHVHTNICYYHTYVYYILTGDLECTVVILHVVIYCNSKISPLQLYLFFILPIVSSTLQLWRWIHRHHPYHCTLFHYILHLSYGWRDRLKTIAVFSWKHPATRSRRHRTPALSSQDLCSLVTRYCTSLETLGKCCGGMIQRETGEFVS